jgi:hypothetical protein
VKIMRKVRSLHPALPDDQIRLVVWFG